MASQPRKAAGNLIINLVAEAANQAQSTVTEWDPVEWFDDPVRYWFANNDVGCPDVGPHRA